MKHPMQAIHLDSHGVARFQDNAIIQHLCDTGAIDLNKLATMGFSNEDRMQLAQLLGYSVSGFGDLPYADPLVVRVADEIVEKIIKPACVHEVRTEDGRMPGSARIWCQTHGFDCPNNPTTRRIPMAEPNSPREAVAQHRSPLKASQKLDAKFSGVIFKVKNGTIVPDDEYMVFLAKDNAFPDTLRFYHSRCIELGCDQEHIDAVWRTIQRLDVWRIENPSKCKLPDAKGDRLVG